MDIVCFQDIKQSEAFQPKKGDAQMTTFHLIFFVDNGINYFCISTNDLLGYYIELIKIQLNI